MGYAGATAPLGFLFCDASAVSRTGYSALYAAIGTAFGAGDGTTTFNLPDLRGRSIVGLGTNAAVNALALSDGVTTVANRRPQHRHTAHLHTYTRVTGVFTATAGVSGTWNSSTTDNTSSVDGGSGTATDSLDAPAFLVTNYIISTTTVAPVVASNVTAYGGSVASASSIAITGNSTYLLTGTTGVSTATGATAGNTLTLVASGQATGICVVLNNGTTANALSLRDGTNLGIYAGESVTFVMNASGYWVETGRDLRTVLGYTEITSNKNVTSTSYTAGTSVVVAPAITFDGATAIDITFYSLLVDRGTTYTRLMTYDGSTAMNEMWRTTSSVSPAASIVRLTPTAASHTYGIYGYVDAGTGIVYAGAIGGGGNQNPPAYIKISRSI